MSLRPDLAERLNRARADLRMGVPVVIAQGGGAVVAVAAETLGAARLAGLRGLAGGAPGPLALAITARRAATLATVPYDGDLARLALPADAGVDWIAAVADPARDLDTPLKGPFVALRGAAAAGGGAGPVRAALALAKSAQLLPAAVVLPLADGAALAAAEGLGLLDAHAVLAALDHAATLAPVIAARVPMAVARAGRVHVFRPSDGGVEHYAIEIGRPDRAAPALTRLHSACFTGDVLGSLKCDCGAQLHAALAAMAAEGAGVLLYLNQEGRGIGLANKLRAYALQDQGFDTVEANHRLGFEDDERDFRLGAAILRQMGFRAARLMTNNPAKVAMLAANGIAVAERVPLKAGHTDDNAAYLATKAAKSGHLL